MEHDKAKSGFLGYKPSPKNSHTDEELELIKDHIENWNPGGLTGGHIINDGQIEIYQVKI